MGCAFFNKTGAYRDRELPAADRDAYEKHLVSCTECARELARLARLSTFLSAAQMPEMKLERPLWKTRRNRPNLVPFAEFLTAAAAVVIAVCGIWMFNPGARTESASVPGWERMAVGQADAAPAADAEDPIAQVLLRGQP
jgi:anti-sigma factor RsiW